MANYIPLLKCKTCTPIGYCSPECQSIDKNMVNTFIKEEIPWIIDLLIALHYRSPKKEGYSTIFVLSAIRNAMNAFINKNNPTITDSCFKLRASVAPIDRIRAKLPNSPGDPIKNNYACAFVRSFYCIDIFKGFNPSNIGIITEMPATFGCLCDSDHSDSIKKFIPSEEDVKCILEGTRELIIGPDIVSVGECNKTGIFSDIDI